MQDLRTETVDRRRRYGGTAVALCGAIVLTVLCYWPSLDGPFLFDDIPNLELMGERGGLTSVDRYLEFISTPMAGPLGRPVSLATFTLNASDWPADPRPFRMTNLVIHLANGLLLFLLTRSFFAVGHQRETASKLALLCMVLWLLHPLLVSTTAYIVQRMTQLSTLFVLLGLLCFIRGRAHLSMNQSRGWPWILAGMGGFGLLAVLSKESGILLPLYALVIELTIYRTIRIPRVHGRALLAVLVAPLLALLVYMTINWGSYSSAFEIRSFTMLERLLTQPVVVLEYLRQIVAPELSGLGIFHDDFVISTGLLSPPVTLLALVIVASLIAFAIGARRRWPFISLGILWFFAGHALEAGPLSLELYFEHRNYLPLLGPLIIAVSLIPAASQKLRRMIPFVVAVFVVMECFMTWQNAAMWGSEERYMRTALVEHPNSLRAQQYRANALIVARQYDDALAVQERLAEQFPEHTSTRLSILNLRCITGTLTGPMLSDTLGFLESSNHDVQVVSFLSVLTNNAAAGTCPEFGFDELHDVFRSLRQNPKFAANDISLGAVLYSQGIAYKRSGDLLSALQQLDLSYTANPEIDIPIQQTVWLLEADMPGEAQRYLSRAREHRSRGVLRRSFRESDIRFLQQQIDQRLPGQ